MNNVFRYTEQPDQSHKGMEMPRSPKEHPKAQHEGEISLTVSRALQLLSMYDPSRAELGVSELSRMLDLSRTAVQRLIQTLEMHHFLEQSPTTRKYRIGVQAFRVGTLFTFGRQLEILARPELDALVEKTRFTAYLSVLRYNTMVMTAAVEGAGPIRYYAQIGQRLPLHSTATGKVALAQLSPEAAGKLLDQLGMPRITPGTIIDRRRLQTELATIRQRGYSVNWEENTVGVGSIAAPIRDASGDLLAVLSIAFATSQVERSQIASLGAQVFKTAAKISVLVRPGRPSAAA